MTKIYKKILLFLVLTLPCHSFATVITVAVQSSSFAPSSLNAIVGDTIIWTWGGGSHTTTSTNVPSGAAMWDSPITSSNPAFAYQVTVVGTYDYVCTPHGFTGQLIVTGPSGISTPSAAINFNIYSVRESIFNINYSLHHSSEIKISVYDITGKKVAVLLSDIQPAGEYLHTYNLADFQQGIYIFELLAGNKRMTKRIIID